MTHRHDDADPVEHDPVEHDPTGMRALLSSLPDPGPMPEDLVERITAALAEESAATPRVDVGPVVPLRRRRSWQLLAAAAAVLVVLGVGGVVLEQLDPGGVETALGLAEGADDAGSAQSAAEADPRAPDGAVASAGALGVVVVSTGGDYTAGDLGEGAARLADEARGAGPGADTTVGTVDVVATAAGARDCASALGIDPEVPVVVDLARVDGRPAAVVLTTGAGEPHLAWAVQRTCHRGDPGVITGPVAAD